MTLWLIYWFKEGIVKRSSNFAWALNPKVD
jgi:hypothetical protein